MNDVNVGDRVRIGYGDGMIDKMHRGKIATVIPHTRYPYQVRVCVRSIYFPFLLEVWVTSALLLPVDDGEAT